MLVLIVQGAYILIVCNYCNCLKIKEDAHIESIEKRDAAETLYRFNSALMTRGELRSKDAYVELEKFVRDPESTVSERIREKYETVRVQLEEIVNNEPVHGTSAKLEKLCSLLRALYSRMSDPRGWLVCWFAKR